MTVQETKYNSAGGIVSQRDVLPGDSVPMEEVPTTDVFVLPKGEVIALSGVLPPVVKTLHVLTRHPETGEDRATITPKGTLLTGREINVVFPSKEPGVAQVRVTSTPNPAPLKPRQG